MTLSIKVEGLAELRRALKDLERVDQRAELRDGLKAAADIVAQEAKRHVPVRSGRAAASIRATAGGNVAYVRGGTKAVPYYGWLDFGTRRPLRGRPRSIGPWKGSGKSQARGRFIYVALDSHYGQVVELVEQSIHRVVQREGLQ